MRSGMDRERFRFFPEAGDGREPPDPVPLSIQIHITGIFLEERLCDMLLWLQPFL